ncbi:unannotated protein [freshwater metagenome]|uniref:Unannotated protein n=1 Tax=freshwater metagenome TaxID=449393 RepID=A0A6J7QGC8_9ZZZZ
MALDLEGNGPTITNIYNTGVFTNAYQKHVCLGRFLTELAEMNFR